MHKLTHTNKKIENSNRFTNYPTTLKQNILL